MTELQQLIERVRPAVGPARAKLRSWAFLGAEASRRQAGKRARRLLRVIEAIRAEGATTSAAIARGLNVRGVKTSQGNAWTGRGVARVRERGPE